MLPGKDVPYALSPRMRIVMASWIIRRETQNILLLDSIVSEECWLCLLQASSEDVDGLVTGESRVCRGDQPKQGKTSRRFYQLQTSGRDK
jgi:hypothetical protein